MKCKQAKCPNEAGHRFTWPGRDESEICASCLPKLVATAKAIGLHLQVLPLLTPPDPNCERCEGCGLIASTEAGEPWTAWRDLPAGSDLAVKMGVVKPIPCPACRTAARGEE